MPTYRYDDDPARFDVDVDQVLADCAASAQVPVRRVSVTHPPEADTGRHEPQRKGT